MLALGHQLVRRPPDPEHKISSSYFFYDEIFIIHGVIKDKVEPYCQV
jgi:hypothetical protein